MELAVAIAVSWALVSLAAAGRRSGMRASKQEEAVSRAWIDGFRTGVRAAREDVALEELRKELRFEGFDR